MKIEPQAEAAYSSTVKKNITAIIFFITRRASGHPPADEELRYRAAEGKSTGSSFSRLLKLNFTLPATAGG
jgi:hypothetical protein